MMAKSLAKVLVEVSHSGSLKMLVKPSCRSVGRGVLLWFTEYVCEGPPVKVFSGGDIVVDAEGVSEAPCANHVEGGEFF
jgi:hypothetical protein